MEASLFIFINQAMAAKKNYILIIFISSFYIGKSQDSGRLCKPFRLNASLVINPAYYVQIGGDIEPTYTLIDQKLTIGLRYLELIAFSNTTSSQSLCFASDYFFNEKAQNVFCRFLGIGAGFYNNKDSTNKMLGEYTSIISANHFGIFIRAGGENRITHSRLSLEYDFVPETKPGNIRNGFFSIVFGLFIWGGYYKECKRKYDYRFNSY
jgi:hypothetical protein